MHRMLYHRATVVKPRSAPTKSAPGGWPSERVFRRNVPARICASRRGLKGETRKDRDSPPAARTVWRRCGLWLASGGRILRVGKTDPAALLVRRRWARLVTWPRSCPFRTDRGSGRRRSPGTRASPAPSAALRNPWPRGPRPARTAGPTSRCAAKTASKTRRSPWSSLPKRPKPSACTRWGMLRSLPTFAADAVRSGSPQNEPMAESTVANRVRGRWAMHRG